MPVHVLTTRRQVERQLDARFQHLMGEGWHLYHVQVWASLVAWWPCAVTTVSMVMLLRVLWDNIYHCMFATLHFPVIIDGQFTSYFMFWLCHWYCTRFISCGVGLTSALAVPWLRSLVAGLSPRRSGFAPGSINVGFVVDKVALGQVFLRVLRFSPVNIIPSSLSKLISSGECVIR
jgi:hypothetical protein